EILAFRDGVVLPFIALQARLGREDPSAAVRAEVPVIYVAFDVLGLSATSSDTGFSCNGTGTDVVALLLEKPLAERRPRLDGPELPPATEGGAICLALLQTASSEDALEAAFAEARGRRNEGLMLKDPKSAYSPCRRGYGWLKMKKALATIDCVVVGVEVGHGK